MTTAAVVLAGGGGRRFDGPVPKLCADFRGRPLVQWALDAAVAAGFDETLVITGAVDLATLVPAGVRIVDNPRWAEGQATSLAAAVAAAHESDHDAIVVGLGDQPLIPAEAWTVVGTDDSPISVATYAGRRRNPVRLHRSVWSLLPVDGDVGAKPLIEERADLVREIPCPGSPVDIDTPEDLIRWS